MYCPLLLITSDNVWYLLWGFKCFATFTAEHFFVVLFIFFFWWHWRLNVWKTWSSGRLIFWRPAWAWEAVGVIFRSKKSKTVSYRVLHTVTCGYCWFSIKLHNNCYIKLLLVTTHYYWLHTKQHMITTGYQRLPAYFRMFSFHQGPLVTTFCHGRSLMDPRFFVQPWLLV